MAFQKTNKILKKKIQPNTLSLKDILKGILKKEKEKINVRKNVEIQERIKSK